MAEKGLTERQIAARVLFEELLADVQQQAFLIETGDPDIDKMAERRLTPPVRKRVAEQVKKQAAPVLQKLLERSGCDGLIPEDISQYL